MRRFYRPLNNGFSLIEIIFSVLILAGTMIPIAGMMGYGFEGTKRDQRQITAIQLCQSRLNQAMSVSFDALVNSNTTIASGGQVLLTLGDVTQGNTSYNVSLQVVNRPVSYRYAPVDVNSPGYLVDTPSTWVFQAPILLDINDNAAKTATIIVSWIDHGKQQSVELSTIKANLQL